MEKAVLIKVVSAADRLIKRIHGADVQVRQPQFVLFDIGRFRSLVMPPAAPFFIEKRVEKRLKGRLPL